MTPEEYRAWRKAYDAKRYADKIKPQRAARCAAVKQRPLDEAYRCGYAAGQRDAVKDAAERFADFTKPIHQPTTTEEH